MADLVLATVLVSLTSVANGGWTQLIKQLILPSILPDIMADLVLATVLVSLTGVTCGWEAQLIKQLIALHLT
jgi:hypothetical protein